LCPYAIKVAQFQTDRKKIRFEYSQFLVMPTRWIQISLAIYVLFFAGIVQSHPFGAERVAHRIRITVSENHLLVDYQIAIPTRLLNRENRSTNSAAEKQIQAKKMASLRKGISVRANGKPVALDSTDLGEARVRARSHSYLYELRLEGALPKNSHTLAISNQNYPDERAYFRTDLGLAQTLEVRSSSLHAKQSDGSIQDRTGRWWMDDDLREFNLSFGPKPTRKPLRFAWLTGLLLALGFGRFFLRKQRHAKDH
jgi:hypothetical protein